MKPKKMNKPCVNPECGREQVVITHIKIKRTFPFGKKSKPHQLIKTMTTVCERCGHIEVYKNIPTKVIH